MLAGVEAGAQGDDFGMSAPPPIPGYEPSTDPRDFSGLWRAKPVPGSFLPFVLGAELPFTDTAKARVDHALEMAAQGTQLATPHIMCRPTGVNQAIGPIAPVYVLQNAEKMVFVVMDEIRDIRQVYFADAHPADLEPSYGGHSIARWDGDTLRVDTIGYNGRGVLNNAVHSADMHMTQAITKSADGLTLQIEITLDDPATFTQPVTVKREWAWVNGQQPLEFDCEENPREDNFSGMIFEEEYLRPICIQHEGEGEELSKVVCEKP
ncbi:MAG: hypothetical protein JXB36_04420 [Gammaproteobacteria bacterium]|nr:hypothetical protein [Gammaproteobacteria bacterium]